MKTNRHWFGLVIAVALLGAIGTVDASPGQLETKTTTKTTRTTKTKVMTVPAVTKTGWWIRVNTQKTVASVIRFQIGMTRADRHEWRTWTAGEPEEFDVPIELRGLNHLYLRGITEPKSKDAVFCVFFGDHGVQHFKFDGDKDENMKPHDSDHDCKP
ncbi:MAG: hypothetical protein ACJ8M4_08675 [Chthoniobacterales bacterium]